MCERRWDIRRRALGLLVSAALLALVLHGDLPHPHHDKVSAQNCPVCQLGKTSVLRPAVQAEAEPPSASEPNPPREESSRTAEPVFHSEFTRAPPV